MHSVSNGKQHIRTHRRQQISAAVATAAPTAADQSQREYCAYLLYSKCVFVFECSHRVAVYNGRDANQLRKKRNSATFMYAERKWKLHAWRHPYIISCSRRACVVHSERESCGRRAERPRCDTKSEQRRRRRGTYSTYANMRTTFLVKYCTFLFLTDTPEAMSAS